MKIVYMNATFDGIESKLDRLNSLIEQIMLQSGMQVYVDDLPGESEAKFEVEYTDERADIVREHLEALGKSTPHEK